MKTKRAVLIFSYLTMFLLQVCGITMANSAANNFLVRYHLIYPTDDGSIIHGRILLEITNFGDTTATNITISAVDQFRYTINGANNGVLQAGNLAPGATAVREADFFFQVSPDAEVIEEPVWHIEYTDQNGEKQATSVMGEGDSVE